MASVDVLELPRGGFSFENCQRNAFLAKQEVITQKVLKTGTTIVGAICNEGVILGADTRTTVDDTIADKNIMKIHYITKNIYCCGAGTGADTFAVTKMVSSQLELHQLVTGRTVPVCTAQRLLKQYLFRYQGHVSAALVLGGVDINGPTLYSIAPHGSTDCLPYTTMGSGSLAAMAVLEDRWKPNMTLEQGKVLVRDAVRAGVLNDLYSGSHVDLCIITKEKTEIIRPYEIVSKKGVRQNSYKYKRGTTAILSSVTIPLEVEETFVKHIETDAMDTSS